MASFVKSFLLAVCLAIVASQINASTLPPPTTTTTTTTSETSDDTTATTTTTDESSTTTEASETTIPADNDDNTSTTAASTTTTIATTPAPQPPFDCYVCNSGMGIPGSWQFSGCPRTGDVSYQPVSCPSYCFSAVGTFPAGDVIRGCGTALWFPGGQEPEDGCFYDAANQRHLCVCRGHTCNTHDLTAEAVISVQSYLAWKAGNNAASGNSV